MVILRVAGTNLTVPIEAEANLVELLAVAVDVGYSSNLWVLTSLDSILLSRQSVSIVTHRVQYVESVQTLVKHSATINIQRICLNKFLLVFIFCHLVGLVLDPFLVPFLLDFSEVVFHCLYLIILFLFLNIIR